MIDKKISTYNEKINSLVAEIIGNLDIYDFHIINDAEKEHIARNLTRGSVRLQRGMIVTVPESDKMELDFINSEMP